MISKEAQAAYEQFKAFRMEYVDFEHNDFDAATKANSEQINAISDLASLDISWVDTDGVPAERILIPGADPNKYVYYIHGGGWTNGEPAWGHYCVVNIARKCGRNLLSVHYRYAPGYAFPVSHDDCYTAYRWMLRQGIAANPDMNLYDLLELWHRQSMRLANGIITKQDYDEWRYNYPASQAVLEQAARNKRRKDKVNNNE